MRKLLIRIVVLLVIPCLLTDPATAAAFQDVLHPTPATEASYAQSIDLRRFEEEAFAERPIFWTPLAGRYLSIRKWISAASRQTTSLFKRLTAFRDLIDRLLFQVEWEQGGVTPDGEILPGHWRPKGWNAMSAVNGRGDKSNPIERTSSAFRRHSDKSGKQPKAIESLRRAERLFVTELTVLELLRLASAIGEEQWNPTAYRAHGKLEDFLLQFWDPQLRTTIREEMLRQAADWLAVKYAQRALKGSFMNAREAIQSATRLIKALTTWATVLPEKAQEPLIEALAAIAAKWWDDARGPRDKLAELVWADVDPPKSPEWVRTFFKQLANTYNNREDVARFLVLKCLRLARHPSLRKKFGAILEDIGKTNPRTLLEAMLQVIPTLTTEEIRSFQWVKDLFVKVIRKSSGKSRGRIVRNLLELVEHSIGKLLLLRDLSRELKRKLHGKRGRRRARAEKLGKNPNGMHLPLGLMSLMPWGWAYGRVNRWAHGSLWRQWAPTLVAFLIGLIENGLIRLVVIIILAVIAHDNPHILLPTFAAIFAVLHFDGIYWGQETETREVRWWKVFIGYGLGSLLLGYAGYYLLPDNPLLNKLFAAWSHWIAQYVPAPPSLELASFERYITVSLFAGLVHAVYDPIARWIGLPLGVATGRRGPKGGAPGTRSGSLAPEEVKKLRGILLSWRGELRKFEILMKYRQIGDARELIKGWSSTALGQLSPWDREILDGMYEGLPSELMKQIGMIDIDRPLDVPGAIKKIRRPLDRLLGLVGRSSDTGARARSKASPKKGALKQVRPFSDEQAARIIENIRRAYAAGLKPKPPELLSRAQRSKKPGKQLFEDFLTIIAGEGEGEAYWHDLVMAALINAEDINKEVQRSRAERRPQQVPSKVRGARFLTPFGGGKWPIFQRYYDAADQKIQGLFEALVRWRAKELGGASVPDRTDERLLRFGRFCGKAIGQVLAPLAYERIPVFLIVWLLSLIFGHGYSLGYHASFAAVQVLSYVLHMVHLELPTPLGQGWRAKLRRWRAARISLHGDELRKADRIVIHALAILAFALLPCDASARMWAVWLFVVTTVPDVIGNVLLETHVYDAIGNTLMKIINRVKIDKRVQWLIVKAKALAEWLKPETIPGPSSWLTPMWARLTAGEESVTLGPFSTAEHLWQVVLRQLEKFPEGTDYQLSVALSKEPSPDFNLRGLPGNEFAKYLIVAFLIWGYGEGRSFADLRRQVTVGLTYWPWVRSSHFTAIVRFKGKVYLPVNPEKKQQEEDRLLKACKAVQHLWLAHLADHRWSSSVTPKEKLEAQVARNIGSHWRRLRNQVDGWMRVFRVAGEDQGAISKTTEKAFSRLLVRLRRVLPKEPALQKRVYEAFDEIPKDIDRALGLRKKTKERLAPELDDQALLHSLEAAHIPQIAQELSKPGLGTYIFEVLQHFRRLGVGPGRQVMVLNSGSGSAVFAAGLLGAKAIGYEINPDLVNKGEELKRRLRILDPVYIGFHPWVAGCPIQYQGVIFLDWEGKMRLPDGLSPDELMAQLRRYVKPGGIVLFRSYTSRKFPFPGWVKIERGFFSKYTAYQKPGGLWQWLVYGLSLVGQRLGWGRSNPRDAFFKLDAIRLGRAV